MHLAIIEIPISKQNFGDDAALKKEVSSILNKCACETIGCHRIQLDLELNHLTKVHYFEIIQKHIHEWKTYDVTLLVPDCCFIKDVTRCISEIESLVRSDEQLLIEESLGFEDVPLGFAFRPRGRVIAKFCEDIFRNAEVVWPPNQTSAISSWNGLMRIAATGIVKCGSNSTTILQHIQSMAGNLKAWKTVHRLAKEEQAYPPLARRYAPTEKSAKEIRLAEELMQTVFTYERIGHDSRSMSLLPNGKVGIGAAGEECFWDIEAISKLGPVLSFSSAHALTCELTQNHDKSWSGQWLRNEQMPVTLRLQPPAPKIVDLKTHEADDSRLKVAKEFIGYDPMVEYDLNVSVLVHCSGKYAKRASAFLRLGLLNWGDYRIHLLIIGSPGDGAHFETLKQSSVRGVDISLLEMSNERPIPKISGHYLWLKASRLRARWFLRVDDDSITDIAALIRHVDSTFSDQPVHLMTSPCTKEIFGPMFETFAMQNGFHLSHLLHEYESSISSSSAMEAVFNHARALEFIDRTARCFDSPGDRALAFAMQIAQVPVASNPMATKDFNADFSLIGGRYYHIHYVNWSNLPMQKFLASFCFGSRRKIAKDDVANFSDVALLLYFPFETTPRPVSLTENKTAQGVPTRECFNYQHVGEILYFLRNGVILLAFTSLAEYESQIYMLGTDLTSGKVVSLSRQ